MSVSNDAGYEALWDSILKSCSPFRHDGMGVWAPTFNKDAMKGLEKQVTPLIPTLPCIFAFKEMKGLVFCVQEGTRPPLLCVLLLRIAIPASSTKKTLRGSCILHTCTFSGLGSFPPGSGEILAQAWSRVSPRKRKDQKGGLGLDYRVLTLHRPWWVLRVSPQIPSDH